jgi:hypothetical protein
LEQRVGFHPQDVAEDLAMVECRRADQGGRFLFGGKAGGSALHWVAALAAVPATEKGYAAATFYVSIGVPGKALFGWIGMAFNKYRLGWRRL